MLRPRPDRPVVTTTEVGDYQVALAVKGGTLVKRQGGKLLATISSRTSHAPVSGLHVLLIIPHLYPSTGQELMEFLELARIFGDPGEPATGERMVQNNIGETGNATTVEEAPGQYGLVFTPVYAAPHEVQVMIMNPRTPGNLLQAALCLPVSG